MLDKEYLDTWNTREENLTALDIQTYKEFLDSNLWKELKTKARKRSNYQKCYLCGCKDNLEFHHLSYKHLTELRNVRSVCRTHHQEIHDYAKDNGISVRLATNHLKKEYSK